MSIQLNAGEVFDIGIQIEKNGKAFYLEASKAASDETIRRLFADLSEWEDKHIELFKKLKSELPERIKADTLFDPNNEYYTYLQAAADSHVFVKSTDISQLVAQCRSPVEALDMALTFEKDSVVYYTTIKKAASPHLGQDKIDILIDEELSHVSLLNNTKRQIERDRS